MTTPKPRIRVRKINSKWWVFDHRSKLKTYGPFGAHHWAIAVARAVATKERVK